MSILDVRLDYADKLKDTEVLGKQDPYCILQLGTSTSRSRTCTDGGTRPVWNETFRFNNADFAPELLVTIKNENVMTDDIIGTCRVPLQKVKAAGVDASQHPVITPRGQQKGFLSLTLTYHAAAGQAQALSGQQQQQQQPYPSAAPSAPYMPPAAGTGYYPQQPQQQQQQPGYPAAYPPAQSGYPPSQQPCPQQAAPYPPQQQQQQPYPPQQHTSSSSIPAAAADGLSGGTSGFPPSSGLPWPWTLWLLPPCSAAAAAAALRRCLPAAAPAAAALSSPRQQRNELCAGCWRAGWRCWHGGRRSAGQPHWGWRDESWDESWDESASDARDESASDDGRAWGHGSGSRCSGSAWDALWHDGGRHEAWQEEQGTQLQKVQAQAF